MNLRVSILSALGAAALPAGASLADGLVAYYDFETGFQDRSGNGHQPVPEGSPEAAWGGGPVTRGPASVDRPSLLAGKALNLVDADGDLLKAPLGSGSSAVAAGSFDLGGHFTISMWHLLAPLPDNASPRYFVFEAETNYDVSWGISAGDTYVPYNSQVSGLSAILPRHAWHHIVHVFETAGGMIALSVYVNGSLAGQVTANRPDMNFGRLVIGNARNGQDRKWDGLLDEAAVWNRALAPLEVNELHARGLAGIGATADLAAFGKAFVTVASAQPHMGSVSGGGMFDTGAEAVFNAGAHGTSDRSSLLAGKALNLVDIRNQAITVPLGSAELGQSFTISVWHSLTPGTTNVSGGASGTENNPWRFQAFEASSNYDVSWGTGPGSGATGSYNVHDYIAYIGSDLANNVVRDNPTGYHTAGHANSALGVWHHVVFAVSASDGTSTLTVYLNGAPLGTATAATAEMDIEALIFGRQRAFNPGDPPAPNTQDRNWDGMMDELAIWDRALTPEEIAEIHAKGFAGVPLLDPLEPPDDTDGDGLSDYDEAFIHGTDPNRADSDGDGLSDAVELTLGTNPLSSDGRLVSYVLARLCGGDDPETEVHPLVFRDSHAGTIRFRLSAESSTALSGWEPYSLAPAGASSSSSAVELRMAFPADPKRFYRFAPDNR